MTRRFYIKYVINRIVTAGEQMGISVSTVKDHMANARQAIKDFILSHGEVMVLLVFCMVWKRG
jgi:predicted DNA-binding protein (UPF0251 family)